MAFRAYEFILIDIRNLIDIDANTLEMKPFIALVTSYHLSIFISRSAQAVEPDRLPTVILMERCVLVIHDDLRLYLLIDVS